MAVAFGVAFAASWIMGIKEDAPDEAVSDETTSACSETNETSTEQFPETSDNEILSPLSGKVIALEDVPDSTFAEGVLGLGAQLNHQRARLLLLPTELSVQFLIHIMRLDLTLTAVQSFLSTSE